MACHDMISLPPLLFRVLTGCIVSDLRVIQSPRFAKGWSAINILLDKFRWACQSKRFKKHLQNNHHGWAPKNHGNFRNSSLCWLHDNLMILMKKSNVSCFIKTQLWSGPTCDPQMRMYIQPSSLRALQLSILFDLGHPNTYLQPG